MASRSLRGGASAAGHCGVELCVHDLNLRPVTFAYRKDAQRVKHYGLIAGEVEKIYPGLVTHTPAGEVQTVKYYELIPMLLNELQRVRQELAELRAQGQGGGGETAALLER